LKLNHPNLIRAIIVEDEKVSSDYLLTMLAKNHPYIEVITVANTVQLAVIAIQKEQPDIVFLDIQIQKGTGFDVLDQLGDKLSFEVIFTTGYVDFKEKALDYFAFYYLNKPLDEHQVKKVLDTYIAKKTSFDLEKYIAFKNQLDAGSKQINVLVKGSYHAIVLDDLIYCKADGNYTYLYTTKGDFMVSKNLKKIESLIAGASFFRIHRAILLNIKHVKNISNKGIITLSNNKEIATSTRNKKQIINVFQLYKNS